MMSHESLGICVLQKNAMGGSVPTEILRGWQKYLGVIRIKKGGDTHKGIENMFFIWGGRREKEEILLVSCVDRHRYATG